MKFDWDLDGGPAFMVLAFALGTCFGLVLAMFW